MEDFQVFVKPVGAACNLACHYCYYKEKHLTDNSFRMGDELLEKYFIQHLLASTGTDIFFSWHGGEPTLAGLSYFEHIVKLQKKLVPKHFRIVNGLQTNGTLLNKEWCQFLKSENFVVGISIDGPEKFHSVNRIGKNGGASFKDVLHGYQLLFEYGIPCEILCVVNSVNVNNPLEIYRYFKQLNAGFITFLPLVERDTMEGRLVSQRSVDAKAFGAFLCAIFDEWKVADIGSIKIQIFEEALREAFQLGHTLCIFKKSCGGVPVLEVNGDLYPCDHFVNEQNLLGNITRSSLAGLLNSPEMRSFGQTKFTTLPQYCLDCEVRDLCNGACPKDRFLVTPAGEPGLNYLCEGYRLFFNHCRPFIDYVAQVWQSGISID